MSYVDHISRQIQLNVEFLVQQGHMSQQDADDVFARLPSGAMNSQQATTPIPVARGQPAVRATPAPPPSPPPPSQLTKARALWSYNEDGSDPNDLSFKAGDVIEVIEKTNNEWWTGKLNGKRGLFPSNYVEKISIPTDSTLSRTGHRILTPLPDYKQISDGVVQPPSEKAPYRPFGAALHGADAPPPPGSGQVNSVGLQEDGGQEKKKSKFGKYGNTMAHSAAGGVGFGAGAAIGGGLVRAIF